MRIGETRRVACIILAWLAFVYLGGRGMGYTTGYGGVLAI